MDCRSEVVGPSYPECAFLIPRPYERAALQVAPRPMSDFGHCARSFGEKRKDRVADFRHMLEHLGLDLAIERA